MNLMKKEYVIFIMLLYVLFFFIYLLQFFCFCFVICFVFYNFIGVRLFLNKQGLLVIGKKKLDFKNKIRVKVKV